MAAFSGKCSRCRREYYADHPDVVVCDCYMYCPVCGSEMAAYTLDLASNVYGKGDRRDLQVIMVCNNSAAHPDGSPFFSTKKPVEVELTSEQKQKQ